MGETTGWLRTTGLVNHTGLKQNTLGSESALIGVLWPVELLCVIIANERYTWRPLEVRTMSRVSISEIYESGVHQLKST